MNFIPKIVFGPSNSQVVFEFPPSNDFRSDHYTANTKTTESSNGKEQNAYYYTENIKNLNFQFVSEAIKDAYETFFNQWGKLGKSFKYFESSDESSFILVTLDKKSFKPSIVTPMTAPNVFTYEIQITLRELIP
jgi:hypothetical protein